MSLTGVTFANQKVTPSDDGRLYSAMLSEGILTGCGITFAAATLSISPGSLLIVGRELRTSGETLSITGATSGYARVIIDIDLTKAATKDSFEQAQWAVQYAASLDAFAALEQQNINYSGTHYQAVFCVLSLGSAGITSINSRMSYATANIADGAITMAKLANDVKYTKTYWRSTPSELLAEWHCGIVYPDSASVYFAITPNIAASLPVGYRCRIVSYLQTELRWGDFGDSSIEIISSGEGKAYYSRYGTITIPQNRYVDIERTGNSIWLLSGSYADHMISSGTAAPSGGNDGDVYIQYS